MSNLEIILVILVAMIATMLTRFLPFIIFRKQEKQSQILLIFEKAMPLAIMVILVFYTIKSVDFLEVPFGIAEILSIFITIFLHIRFNNVLLSIIGSTVFYMFLVQIVVPKIV
ncbi:branched-chain amino acid transporter permease [Aliarcobacter vitoriensis]|uniref:Branched-chain amino acid ABC transporter n=1 Tax=Aliarcobacter vitoriensis TaxID=2011099 RepID=A0A366MVG7_9BACT|nr:AzlD domain-containing protein [Aliarcobacter vitoriensis]RBQ29382.1 branched-chain amino acid ABC transporter [Aliarcobacter vitoriensis]RBQ31522.1 branched-chain amino acid ABC transporter [Arcobacter sp. FW59]